MVKLIWVRFYFNLKRKHGLLIVGQHRQLENVLNLGPITSNNSQCPAFYKPLKSAQI